MVAFLIYCFAVGPLRNAFDDRWPYINVFLNSPGAAAKTIAVIIGLGVAVRAARNGNGNARLFALGFALILLGGFLNAMYAAWSLDNRTELQSLIFDHPFRLTVWKWYFRIDVNQCVSAVGMVLVVLATVRAMQATAPDSHITKP
jgi:uncharacterized membrane protein